MPRSHLVVALTISALASCATPSATGKAPETAAGVKPRKAPETVGKAAPVKKETSSLKTRRQAEFLRQVGIFHRACGKKIPVHFDWQRYPEELTHTFRPEYDCSVVVKKLADYCATYEAKRVIGSLKAIRCTREGKSTIALTNQVLNLDSPSKGYYDELIEELHRANFRGSSRFGDAVAAESTRLCIDGKHLTLVAPHMAKHAGLSTGVADDFVHVGNYRIVTGRFFYEPRFVGRKPFHERSLPDWRVLSSLEFDLEAGRCLLTCGTQEKKLKLADQATTRQLLAKARYRPRPDIRQPHALARDKRGRYYYVDRSSLKGRQKDFRVYAGRRGKLRQQKMLDVISDSEGEIFATKGGKLRFWVGKKEALWIVGRKRHQLTRVPVRDNLPMIYKELGVYWGKKLYTPCDHF